MIHCQCLSIDLRGHGDTHTDEDDDLSADTLAKYIRFFHRLLFFQYLN